MDSLSLVLLGVIALASLLQAVALVLVAREGVRVARRLDAFADRVGRDLRPALTELERASQNFAEVSDLPAGQARRGDGLVAEAVERTERASAVLQDAILPSPGRPLAAPPRPQAGAGRGALPGPPGRQRGRPPRGLPALRGGRPPGRVHLSGRGVAARQLLPDRVGDPRGPPQPAPTVLPRAAQARLAG